MSPPKALGGIDLPPIRKAQRSHSEIEETPPADNIRDIVRTEQESRVKFRGEMESLALVAKQENIAARDAHAKAIAKSESVEWKMNLLLGMCGTAIMLAIGAFTWLFTLQQASDKRATETASREARIVVLEQDRKFEAKAEAIAQRAVRLDREERARDALTVVAKVPP